MKADAQPLETDDGASLWTRRWLPDDEPRAAVVLVHGLGEHSGRYENVGRRFAGAGVAMHAFDLRGHGRSSGRRGVLRLRQAEQDAARVIANARSASAAPCFLYGHSLGALVVLTLLRHLGEPSLSGAIVSAPPLRNALREQRLRPLLARVLGRVVPDVTLPTGLEVAALSRVPAIVDAYRDDPLVHDRASLGLGRDAMLATDALEEAKAFPVPLLVLHGGADRIAFVEGSRELAGRSTGRLTYREYTGLFHEPHNEPEREQVLDDVLAWVDEQLGG